MTDGAETDDRPERAPAGREPASTTTVLLWAVLSIAGLMYLAFGTVDARIWRFNRLRVESKEVLGIWTLQGDRLPSVTYQWILTSTYYLALVVLVVGVIAALWLLLDESDPDGEPSTGNPDVRAPTD